MKNLIRTTIRTERKSNNLKQSQEEILGYYKTLLLLTS